MLELRGHSAPVNSIEWSPHQRGQLASGGDDSLVLLWDLVNQNNGAAVNGGPQGSLSTVPPAPAQTSGTNQTQNAPTQQKGPFASWRCDYEVANLSWAPTSALTGHGGDWLGVCGGRGVWGVRI